MKKILIIEDDKRIRRILQLELEHEGYMVCLAIDGKDGLKKYRAGNYDVILLDLMMPNISGEELCKEIRKNSEIPIIILTAKDQILNKVELLDMGADDYMTKPFDIEELFARIRVVLRNKKVYKVTNYQKYEDLELNLELKEFKKAGRIIPLTKTEYKLLDLFILNKELVISREKIIQEIWGYDFDGDEKIVDVYINSLRKKIETIDKKYIQTIRGFGYILKLKKGE